MGARKLFSRGGYEYYFYRGYFGRAAKGAKMLEGVTFAACAAAYLFGG